MITALSNFDPALAFTCLSQTRASRTKLGKKEHDATSSTVGMRQLRSIIRQITISTVMRNTLPSSIERRVRVWVQVYARGLKQVSPVAKQTTTTRGCGSLPHDRGRQTRAHLPFEVGECGVGSGRQALGSDVAGVGLGNFPCMDYPTTTRGYARAPSHTFSLSESTRVLRCGDVKKMCNARYASTSSPALLLSRSTLPASSGSTSL